MMNRTIKITGKGKITANPDVMVLQLRQKETYKTYEEAYSSAAKAKDELNRVFETLGISKDVIKTISFDINPEHKSYQKDGEWVNELLGYSFDHSMNVRLDLDNSLLSKAYNALKDMKYPPSMDIRYTLKDQESFKNELIASAIRDSKTKAAVLTNALEVELGEVVNIDYSWSQVEVYSNYERSGLMKMSCFSEDAAIEINPSEIELEDTVTVVWEIR